MFSTRTPSTVIIGAGPAGCICAILLAGAKIPVTLIEQHRFPRDKVCGECLSTVGVDVLDRIGVLRAVVRAGAMTLRSALIHAPSGGSIEIALPRPMLGVSRFALDAALLDLARDNGVRILQPARCEHIDANSAAISIRDLATNSVVTQRASTIVLADGKAALSPARPTPTGHMGIKAHFTDVDGPRDTIELFGVSNHYGGLAPVEDGLWNASFSVPAVRIAQHRGDLDQLFAVIVSENTTLARRMRRASRVSRWLASPVPRFGVADHWAANVIPIGNAAAAIEPIGGEGMGLAMRSAELAANAIIIARDANTAIDVLRLRRKYRQLWSARGAIAHAAAALISRPTLADALRHRAEGL